MLPWPCGYHQHLHNTEPPILAVQVMVDRSRVMGRAGVHAMELRTLGSIMADLGHTWVDIFKVDIEGAEWGVLQGLLASNAPLPFTQMQVQNPHGRLRCACMSHPACGVWQGFCMHACRWSTT